MFCLQLQMMKKSVCVFVSNTESKIEKSSGKGKQRYRYIEREGYRYREKKEIVKDRCKESQRKISMQKERNTERNTERNKKEIKKTEAKKYSDMKRKRNRKIDIMKDIHR